MKEGDNFIVGDPPRYGDAIVPVVSGYVTNGFWAGDIVVLNGRGCKRETFAKKIQRKVK
ncbi:hypothetical protein [Anaerocolumna sp. MB42-C2]|uniref:hypothetical protein n=1 Tax=Anaerocolumna sp. MB42-C2 TaxID=3070997 RepID=UPI0027E08EA0|nr:hypothetical protein [Anaerocolumna sp. MB42-C2]WMJ90206.1 hypothetical protein RBU59_11965 [Anaerocolumna sp. MB42-C2]